MKKKQKNHKPSTIKIMRLRIQHREPFSFRHLPQDAGTGLITGGADDDPWASAPIARQARQLGYGIAGTMLLPFPVMAAIQEISARVGRGHRPRHCRKYVPAFIPPRSQNLSSRWFIANTHQNRRDLGAMAGRTRLWSEVTGIVMCCCSA